MNSEGNDGQTRFHLIFLRIYYITSTVVLNHLTKHNTVQSSTWLFLHPIMSLGTRPSLLDPARFICTNNTASYTGSVQWQYGVLVQKLPFLVLPYFLD